MSVNLQVYANLDPIPFKITKNGVAIAGLTFSTGDIQAKILNGTTLGWSDIDTEVTDEGLGWYSWTPTGTATTGKVVIINVKEVSGTNFDENGLTLETGGHANARHSG